MPPIDTKTDVVELLAQQHDQVKAQLTRVASAPDSQREDQFCELRRLIAVHETAEEIIVYPVVQASGSDGERVAKERTAEEAEGISVLAKLEALPPAGKEFQDVFEKFHTAVLKHAEAEEATVFPILRNESAERRQQMAKAFELAEKAAPTHAHPHTGTSAASKIFTGPVLAIADHVRDALRSHAH